MPEADESTTVLGIDPGTAITGYGVVSRARDGAVSLVECGVIRTSSREDLAVRIREIFEEIRELTDRHAPGVVSVEDVFQGKNVRSALTLGHARGAILLAASLADADIAEYTPGQIKKAVAGRGQATKDQVGFMVMKHLRLRSQPTPDDASDGVAAALCHCLIGDFSS